MQCATFVPHSRYPLSMDDIQIVFEAPQDSQTKKKRARLVTSCDHCRVKKIKCIQSRNSSKCEACGAARVPCRFRDREQYFAERGRLMSRNSPASFDRDASTQEASSQISLSILEPQRGRSSASPSVQSSSSSSTSMSYHQPDLPEYIWPPPESSRNSESARTQTALMSPQQTWQASYPTPSASMSPITSMGHGVVNASCGTSETHGSQTPLLPLFDLQSPDRPNPTLMMHFIQTYFDHYGQSFPCLAYDETIRQFLDHSLSPLIASGISALAAWYSELPEVVRRGAADVSGAYCANAQVLLSRGQQAYSVEAVHGLILLAWAEYKRACMPAFCSHVKKAQYIAEHIGLTNGSLILTAGSEYDRSILRSTFALLRQLLTTVETWSA